MRLKKVKKSILSQFSFVLNIFERTSNIVRHFHNLRWYLASQFYFVWNVTSKSLEIIHLQLLVESEIITNLEIERRREALDKRPISNQSRLLSTPVHPSDASDNDGFHLPLHRPIRRRRRRRRRHRSPPPLLQPPIPLPRPHDVPPPRAQARRFRFGLFRSRVVARSAHLRLRRRHTGVGAPPPAGLQRRVHALRCALPAGLRRPAVLGRGLLRRATEPDRRWEAQDAVVRAQVLLFVWYSLVTELVKPLVIMICLWWSCCMHSLDSLPDKCNANVRAHVCFHVGGMPNHACCLCKLDHHCAIFSFILTYIFWHNDTCVPPMQGMHTCCKV